jgi:hypothetical protein
MESFSFINKTVLMAIFMFFINACHKEEAVQTADIIGEWRVISFDDYETLIVITKTDDNTWNQFNNGDITLSFIQKDLTKGIISGIKVTNGFSGKYLITSNGDIKISDFIQTAINEPEWGILFDSIKIAERYEVKNDCLKIYYNGGMNSITLEKINK